MYVANWGHEFGPGTRITKCTLSTQEFLLDIGSAGSGDGEFLWPGGLAIDGQENLYVTDQAISKIVVFTKDGEFVGKWGSLGSGDGQFKRPSGIALDPDGNLVIVDSGNNRVQRYTCDGSSSASLVRAAAMTVSWIDPGASTSTATATSSSPTGETTGCRSSPPAANTSSRSAVPSTNKPTSASPALSSSTGR